MTRRSQLWCLLILAGSLLPAHAAKISELGDTGIIEQALRFFTFRDPSVRYALAGSMLLGITCGLLGSFIVVRKMALVGDALSHAVLPGVAIGFLWNMSKDPVAIFIGATIAGLLGTVMVRLITQTTHLKEDTALGLVLATSRMTSKPSSNSSPFGMNTDKLCINHLGGERPANNKSAACARDSQATAPA